MGCNCKATKKIAYINQRYGTTPPQKKTNIVGNIKDIFAYIIMLLFLPIIFLHVLYVQFIKKDKKITFSAMFGKKKKSNVRKQ
jgi:hypothetical protein